MKTIDTVANTSHGITIRDVYGEEWVANNLMKVYDKYNFVFRPPQIGDKFIARVLKSFTPTDILNCPYDYTKSDPRIVIIGEKTTSTVIEAIYGTSVPFIPELWCRTGDLTNRFKQGQYYLKPDPDGKGNNTVAKVKADCEASVYRLPVRRYTMKDIYGTDGIYIPPTYKFEDFRIPRPTDIIVSHVYNEPNGLKDVASVYYLDSPIYPRITYTTPRIILRHARPHPNVFYESNLFEHLVKHHEPDADVVK